MRDAPPEGWTATKTGTGDPKWAVEQDETAPLHSKVVKQSGRATYPVLLKNDTNIMDGFIEMKFKAVAGAEDRAAGLVWRAKDASNCYVVRANALEDNVVLYKTVNGVRRASICRPQGWLRDRHFGACQSVAQPAHQIQRQPFYNNVQRQKAVRGRRSNVCRSWHGRLVDQSR